MSMDLILFKTKLFDAAKAAGFSDWELYYSKSDDFNVEIFKGEIFGYQNSATAGVSFRGTFNGKIGYSYSEKIEEDVIDFLVGQAKQNAEVLEEETVEELFAGAESYPEVQTFNPELESVSPAEKIDAAVQLEKLAYAVDPRIKSVVDCVINTGGGETAIYNSLGLSLSAKSNFALAFVGLNSEENGKTKIGYGIWAGDNWKNLDVSKVAGEAARQALAKLNSESIVSGDYPVIFENTAFISLLGAFLPVFFAENVQKGFSLLEGKLGTGIASSALTLRDDPLLPGLLGSAPFDSEGVPTRNKAVVENGILKTFLHNLKTAAKDGVAPTGNGFKPSFRAPVMITGTNFYASPSETPRSGLLAQMGEGLMLTELEGLHSGANIISGDFSLLSSGFVVENGKIARPVEQITVAGNFYDLLKDIVAVASDFRYSFPSSAGYIGSPSVFVKSLACSGEKAE